MKKKDLIYINIYLLMIVIIAVYFLGSVDTMYKSAEVVGKKDILSAEEIIKVQDYRFDKYITDMSELLTLHSSYNLNFNANMTSYGPDCVGCSGRLACNGMNVSDGNIYYQDQVFGKVRIIASDYRVPCGTIFKVSGFLGKEPFYVINFDRGGAIKSFKFDLLEASEAAALQNGVQGVKMNLVRWGYDGRIHS